MKKVWISFLVIAVFAGSVLFVQAQTTPSFATLTSRAYEQQVKANNDKIIVVMFTMGGCAPCLKAKKSVWPQIVKKYENDDQVDVFLFPTDKDKAASDGSYLHKTAGIEKTPTFAVLYNGGVEVAFTGFSDGKEQAIQAKIAQLVKSHQ